MHYNFLGNFQLLSVIRTSINNFSTILHHMEIGVMWYGMIFITLIEIIEVFRMLFGPLNSKICWLQSYFRNGPILGATLCLDALVLFRVIKYFNLKSKF